MFIHILTNNTTVHEGRPEWLDLNYYLLIRTYIVFRKIKVYWSSQKRGCSHQPPIFCKVSAMVRHNHTHNPFFFLCLSRFLRTSPPQLSSLLPTPLWLWLGICAYITGLLLLIREVMGTRTNRVASAVTRLTSYARTWSSSFLL